MRLQSPYTPGRAGRARRRAPPPSALRSAGHRPQRRLIEAGAEPRGRSCVNWAMETSSVWQLLRQSVLLAPRSDVGPSVIVYLSAVASAAAGGVLEARVLLSRCQALPSPHQTELRSRRGVRFRPNLLPPDKDLCHTGRGVQMKRHVLRLRPQALSLAHQPGQLLRVRGRLRRR
jgi:hypothetical protein